MKLSKPKLGRNFALRRGGGSHGDQRTAHEAALDLLIADEDRADFEQGIQTLVMANSLTYEASLRRIRGQDR